MKEEKEKIKEKVLEKLLTSETPKELVDIQEDFNQKNALKVLNFMVEKAINFTIQETANQIFDDIEKIGFDEFFNDKPMQRIKKKWCKE